METTKGKRKESRLVPSLVYGMPILINPERKNWIIECVLCSSYVFFTQIDRLSFSFGYVFLFKLFFCSYWEGFLFYFVVFYFNRFLSRFELIVFSEPRISILLIILVFCIYKICCSYNCIIFVFLILSINHKLKLNIEIRFFYINFMFIIALM